MASKIPVLGTGGAKCASLAKNVEAKPTAAAACDGDCTSHGGTQSCHCATEMGGAGSGCCCCGGGRGSSLRLWLFPLIALAVAGVLLLRAKNKPAVVPSKPAATAAGVPSKGEMRAAPDKTPVAK